ncbi:MAG: flagellar export chaperone FlgN [Bdellovibrionota bacterium]
MIHEWIQNLCSVLDRMEGLYTRILPLLDRERAALVEFDYERLYADLTEKDEILATIRRLDRERLRFQDYFSTVTGKPAQEISLRWIGEYLISEGGSEAELGVALLARRERVENLVAQITERVQRNGRFIERSVKNIRNIAQGVSDALGLNANQQDDNNSSQHQTYNGKGKAKKGPQKSGALVSKQL